MAKNTLNECKHQNKILDFNFGEDIYYYCPDCFYELLYTKEKIEKAWKSELGPLKKIATARKGIFHYLMKLEERKIVEQLH
ncbi:MAG: hypothetical protein EAX96_11890 [Candidatus Lokiarchaeota archaeon]|nr:hypothetical protein [Candidatus Lokiarchaeota archaeon]